MTGLSDTHTDIILTMTSANLVRALGVVGRSIAPNSIKLKLVNKNIACLCVEMEIPSSVTEKNRIVTNDVPVNVVSRRDWENYKIPTMPHFGMIVTTPCAKDIKPAIETLKTTSPVICIQAVREGIVSFIAEATMAKISCHCRDQVVTCSPNEENDVISCQIDTKKLAVFLTSSQFPNTPMSCSISEDRLVRFEIQIQEEATMTCAIPATNN